MPELLIFRRFAVQPVLKTYLFCEEGVAFREALDRRNLSKVRPHHAKTNIKTF